MLEEGDDCDYLLAFFSLGERERRYFLLAGEEDLLWLRLFDQRS